MLLAIPANGIPRYVPRALDSDIVGSDPVFNHDRVPEGHGVVVADILVDTHLLRELMIDSDFVVGQADHLLFVFLPELDSDRPTTDVVRCNQFFSTVGRERGVDEHGISEVAVSFSIVDRGQIPFQNNMFWLRVGVEFDHVVRELFDTDFRPWCPEVREKKVGGDDE